MKFRQICAAALAAVVLVSGCSKPRHGKQLEKYTRDGEGRVIPISDEYIPANYTPRSDDWSVMLREIPGSFGQETDQADTRQSTSLPPTRLRSSRRITPTARFR